ncbi:hypothetical protein K3G63_19300 [Hymenobacter sp. HSC-4F20]|uniref:hypothetical protein n=1 Tax=Hymenobacter sp. HSC-4F20 TaxID=2864135 RepID=UPI001C732DF4|nr:hypothetical protein [Hymenobacter sp. HSC-4F20]MBX0292599.1 hypothetical protein [Hymenobacter sp. HSC-4F20]
MITNQPTPRDYKSLADSCLTQAFDIIFETDKIIDNHQKKLDEEIVWEYLQDKLNASVVLIHQAIEANMKSVVCSTSPYLLIEGKKNEWPVLPNQGNKRFDEFFSISSESLVYVFFATARDSYDDKIADHIEYIRKLRNQIVHGISRNRLTARDLISYILDTYTFFDGLDAWWDSLRNYYFEHPFNAGMDQGELETVVFIERLTYAWKKIGKSSFSKHFSVNTKERSYFCPYCLPEDKALLKKYDYKWAFLFPEGKNASLIRCINCTNDNQVSRVSCPIEGCAGTVIWEDYLCLTCGREIRDELRKKKEAITKIIASLSVSANTH